MTSVSRNGGCGANFNFSSFLREIMSKMQPWWMATANRRTHVLNVVLLIIRIVVDDDDILGVYFRHLHDESVNYVRKIFVLHENFLAHNKWDIFWYQVKSFSFLPSFLHLFIGSFIHSSFTPATLTTFLFSHFCFLVWSCNSGWTLDYGEHCH